MRPERLRLQPPPSFSGLGLSEATSVASVHTAVLLRTELRTSVLLFEAPAVGLRVEPQVCATSATQRTVNSGHIHIPAREQM